MSIQLLTFDSSTDITITPHKGLYGDTPISSTFHFSKNDLIELPAVRFKFPPKKFNPDKETELYSLSFPLPTTNDWKNLQVVRTLFKKHANRLIGYEYNDFVKVHKDRSYIKFKIAKDCCAVEDEEVEIDIDDSNVLEHFKPNTDYKFWISLSASHIDKYGKYWPQLLIRRVQKV